MFTTRHTLNDDNSHLFMENSSPKISFPEAKRIKTNTAEKPPYSYAMLIAQAIVDSPFGRKYVIYFVFNCIGLPLSEIYAWIRNRYGYYRDHNTWEVIHAVI